MLSEQREHSSILEFKTKVIKVLNAASRYLFLVTAVFGIQYVFASEIQLSASETESTAGYFTLTWESDSKSKKYTLQQSSDKLFQGRIDTIIKWDIDSHDSFSVSGLNSGVYYYRIAEFDKPNSWSNTVQVSVKHHTLDKAYFIFALGAVLFFLLITIIFLNYKNKSRGF